MIDTHLPPHTSGRTLVSHTSSQTCGLILPKPRRWQLCCSTYTQLFEPVLNLHLQKRMLHEK